jgi:hypothetical protein
MDQTQVACFAAGAAVVAATFMMMGDQLCKPAGKRSPEAAVVESLRSEWAAVGKTAGGRVDRASFKAHCHKKHVAQLTRASKDSFDAFLDRAFDAGVGLMLAPGKPEKADLGRHCFSYALLLAGEFYFQAAADAQPDGSANCGCGTPVADALGLAKK